MACKKLNQIKTTIFAEGTNNGGAVVVEQIEGQQGRPMYAPFRRPRWRLGSVVCYVALVSPVVIFFVILTVIASIEVSDRGLVTKSICGYEDESHYLFNGLKHSGPYPKESSQSPPPHTRMPYVKHLHQIWNNNSVPKKWEPLQQNCQKLNKNYKYTLWTKDSLKSLIEEHYPWFSHMYDVYARQDKGLDIVRYFVLYHHGGVFLDIDIDCHKSFDYIVQNISKNSDIVLGAIAPMGVTHNFLIAKGRHPFLWSVIHELANTNIWSFFSHYAISENTGPELVWRSYLKYPCKTQIHVMPVMLHSEIFLKDYGHTQRGKEGSNDPLTFCKDYYVKAFFRLVLIVLMLFSLVVIWSWTPPSSSDNYKLRLKQL